MGLAHATLAAPAVALDKLRRWWADAPPLTVAVTAFAVALLLYLPLENWLTAGLTGAAEWAVRLLPDALICALAAIVFVRAPAGSGRYRWLLVAVGMAWATIVIADLLRGHGAVDAINAVRVLIRYVILGAIVAAVQRPEVSFGRVLWTAVILVGLIQILAALFQGLVAILQTGAVEVPVLTGTTGRYDRFGLIMVALILAVLADAMIRPRRWHGAVIGIALAFLFWSTSRQAMVALGAGCVVALCWPQAGRPVRVGAGITLVVIASMVILTGARLSEPLPPEGVGGVPSAGDPGTVLVSPPPRTLGSSTVSIHPDRNFRLYLSLVLAPWAAVEEPIFGLGPGRHVVLDADPRLVDKVETDGLPWSFARAFMNDSNYASLIIQFGVIAPLLYLSLLIGLVAWIAWSMRRRRDLIAPLAVMLGVATLAAAAFGPAFEIRPTTAILWVVIFAALVTMPRRSAD